MKVGAMWSASSGQILTRSSIGSISDSVVYESMNALPRGVPIVGDHGDHQRSGTKKDLFVIDRALDGLGLTGMDYAVSIDALAANELVLFRCGSIR